MLAVRFRAAVSLAFHFLLLSLSVANLVLSAAVAGSIKTSKLVKLGARSDLMWEMFGLVVWSGTENFVVLFCGSVPPLRPFFDRFSGKDASLTGSLDFSFHETRLAEDGPVVVELNQYRNIAERYKKSSMSLGKVSPVHSG